MILMPSLDEVMSEKGVAHLPTALPTLSIEDQLGSDETSAYHPLGLVHRVHAPTTANALQEIATTVRSS